ncbi:hypothetical protein BCV69DRAFT_284216 [Microstroma glucosiphilum]|uniref:Uncharacterized protein n=1 Tax=Pseudomicrostroma glucosiphilum TaxID=1684307 RepID=A0A316U5I1_9BASI|nr:hypothetical protein BCV69DRAFT_284216 [Pseudomicrostroma glucosiphilum]PWN19583.1 hypothetical protein BCV69DRAFT_284216 [Pseudomicrostroma glucosiphilum]
MSSGFDAGAGSHDQSLTADQGAPKAMLSTAGGARDAEAGGAPSAGLSGGQGDEDKQSGLSQGLDGGAGEEDGRGGGSGFDAGVGGGSTQEGGGVSLDGGEGDVDRDGTESTSGLKDKLKDMKSKMSSN